MTPTRTCCRDGIFCTLCCYTHGVPEIDKLPFAQCRHCIEGKGCAAHALPPGGCSEFRCAYLQGMSGDDTWPHLCRFVQQYRWTRYGHTWIISAPEAAKLDTPLARREIIRALERDLVVVIEKPEQTVIMFADNRDALALIPQDGPHYLRVTHPSEYFGFSVLAKPHIPADLGASVWYQL